MGNITHLNGSGSRDIVWADADDYRYLDLTGGERPRLLRIVHNGLGGTTEVFYSSTTEYMADDALAGRPWSSTAPMAVTVVSAMESGDGLGAEYRTEYAYRDPVYDGLEAEFRGFTQPLARAVGDGNTPPPAACTMFTP